VLKVPLNPKQTNKHRGISQDYELHCQSILLVTVVCGSSTVEDTNSMYVYNCGGGLARRLGWQFVISIHTR